MIYGWLSDWISDSTVRAMSNWVNDLWLIKLSGDWPSDWMIYGRLINWVTDSTVQGLLTDRMIYGGLIDWLTDSTVQGLTNWLNDFRLIELSGNWSSNWMIYGWLIDWLTDWMIYGWLTVWLTVWIRVYMGNALSHWNTIWLLFEGWEADLMMQHWP